MGLGLTLLTGLGMLPLLLALWVGGGVLGVIFIAEALERTHGLAPSTYGGAFWLACAFIGLLVVVKLTTWFAPRREGKPARGYLTALLTRPVAAVFLLLLPCFLLVRCDLGGTDVPDILTTTALLCVLGYGLFVLPIAFVSVALRSGRWLWRFGQRSSFRSGLVAGIGAVSGALLPTCLVCTPPDFEEDRPAARYVAAVQRGAEHISDEIGRKGAVDGSLAALTSAATQIPGTTGPWTPLPLQPPLDSRLRACVEQFTAASRRLATVEQAVRWLITNRRADHDTANAVAYGTVFAVCRKHAREAVTGDLDQYFWRSVKNNYCKDLGRNPLAQCGSFDTLDARCDGLPSLSGGQLDAAIDLRARLCRLDERDRDIVLRDFEGQASHQIAADLGMTPANVRKRIERAYKKMTPN
jgi:DNA-directed RNA polymerase specialized sigma24 family protein